jgi:glycosyltransferase involved in cell wall biosynthesis
MIRTSPHIPMLLRPIGAGVGHLMLYRTLAISDAVTYTAKEFDTSMKIKKYNSFLLPNGVDIKRFKPGSEKHKGIIVGYVGALREWVDLRPMLLAVKRLSSHIRITALVVGGEEDLQQYRDFVRDEQMEQLVEFTGNVPYKEVQKYVRKMDICTVPFKKNSVTDGTNPLKLLEYLASAKPVICSLLNEPRNMLGDRILYASNTLEWEMQIEVLSKDPRLRARMGREGRKIVESLYNWKSICERMEKILTVTA